MALIPSPDRPRINAFLDYLYQAKRWEELDPIQLQDIRRNWRHSFAGFSARIDLADIARQAQQLRYLQTAYAECLDRDPASFPPEHPIHDALSQLEQAARLADQAHATIRKYETEIPRIGDIPPF